MKKMFLLLVLCIYGVTVSGNNDGEVTRLEMQIIDALTPAQPDQMRSVVWYAEGWIDYDMNCIAIEINEVIGTADVVITNMYGQPVAGATIDPAVTTYVMLPLPAEGIYRMTITGEEYLGECNFTIE